MEKKIIDIANNKKAYYDYEIIEEIEAGIVLQGTEIKSVREHKVNLKDSFALIRDGEVFVHNMHISPYGYGNIFNHDPTRIRKLLLKKREILKLKQYVDKKGITLIPLKIYIKNKYAKVLLGIAKGKKNYDKKDSIKERDIKREMDREIKNFRL